MEAIQRYILELNFWFLGLSNVDESIKSSWEHFIKHKAEFCRSDKLKYETMYSFMHHINFKALHGTEYSRKAIVLFLDSNSYELICKMIDVGFESASIDVLVNGSMSEVFKATYAMINP